MPTRFLNIDHFGLSPPHYRETLAFLHLTVLRFPSSFPSAIEDHLRFDSLLNVFLLIERLPINVALSNLLSSLLPDYVHVDFQDFEAASSSRDKKGFQSFSIGNVGIQILEEGEGSVLSDMNKSVEKIIEFEAPELDALLGSAWFPEEDIMQILSVSEIPGFESGL